VNIEIGDEYYVTHVQADAEQNIYAQALFEKLRTALNAEGVKEKDYSLGDLRADDCFLLCKYGNFWAVSYLERGMKFRPAFFFEVDDAVHFFLWKLTDGKVTI
jgi:hypothetical protein